MLRVASSRSSNLVCPRPNAFNSAELCKSPHSVARKLQPWTLDRIMLRRLDWASLRRGTEGGDEGDHIVSRFDNPADAA